MNDRQVELVQDSFAYILPIPDRAAAYFYARLFELAPDTRILFKNDMADQGRKLVMTLAAVVGGLSRLDATLSVARELAIRHVRYGVQDRHYAIVGRALLETLAELLGPAFDDETKAAWSDAYAIIADAMVSAARRAA